MASALAHPIFRTSSIDHGIHAPGLSENDLSQYHNTSGARLPSPLSSGPMFLKDVSRSSSGSTQDSSMGHLLFQSSFHTRSASLSAGRAEEYTRQQMGRAALPGLNTLASLAGTRDQQILRSFSTSAASNMQYNAMPAVPTPGISGNHNMPPTCQNCETSTTPLWRRDESGSVLCNACGLFLKLHGRPRPISLKTDVIKSRNRVKTANQGPKKQSLPASQSVDVMQNGAHRRVSEMSSLSNLQRSQSPISRTGTPSMHHDPNIAPQHLFDGVSLQDHGFQAPALPNLGSHPSPGSLTAFTNQTGDSLLGINELIAQNTLLKTRVSELEVINMMYSENENALRKERDDAVKAHEELKRRFEELEQSTRSDLPHPNKKQRLEEDPSTDQVASTTSRDDLIPTLTNEQ